MVAPAKIWKAAHVGDAAAVQAWLSSGTRDPDEKNTRGWTLLNYAAQSNHSDVMRVLLAHGAHMTAPET